MASYHDVSPSWTKVKRKGSRIRTKILQEVVNHTEGRFYMDNYRICFENEGDALVYQLMHPGARRER